MIGRTLGAASGAIFAAVSRLRHAKSLHPYGIVHEATLTVDGTGPRGSALLAAPGEHRALVRFSRSFGLPQALPDLLGMAIRVLDAYGPDRHQDLLMVTSVDAPVLHHVFVPAGDIHERPYTSSLPYGAGDERFLVGAVPAGGGFDLSVAALSGRFRRVGRVTLGRPLPEDANGIRFNVVQNTGGGLAPVGVLNRMRELAYPMSQWGWAR